MQPIIVAENISKRYDIHPDRAFRTLRDSIASVFRPKAQNGVAEEFWALRDISFAVNRGENVGIVGRNGAGKSTLLKIISRITKPTNGKIYLQGKVASLLELGTGFHPELTGRENLFLNAAILGQSRKSIQAKADEIIEFSGISKFIDIPIKRYSSGMQARLGFSVASHSEGEILIIDEIISSGDFEFREKCKKRINELVKSGRTILLVSHNDISVMELCSRVIHISHGRLVNDTKNVKMGVKTYLETPAGQYNG